MSDEWGIGQHKVELVVKGFGDFLRLVEVVLEEVGVLLAELVIELRESTLTSNT